MEHTFTSRDLNRAFAKMRAGEQPKPFSPRVQAAMLSVRVAAQILSERLTQERDGFINRSAPHDGAALIKTARVRREFSAANAGNVHAYLSAALTDDVGSQLKPGLK